MHLLSVNQRKLVSRLGSSLTRHALLISTLASLFWTLPGQAQPVRATAKGDAYGQAIRMGIQEYKFGNWLEAKAFFSEAHALRPNTRTLRGLAMVSYELRSYVDAAQNFRAALSSSERPLTPKMRKDAKRFLKQAENFVGYLRVRTVPQGAKVTVDGRPPIVTGDGRWMLDPGGHELVVSAPGHRVVTRNIRVASGSNPDLNIQLGQAALAHRLTAEDGAKPGVADAKPPAGGVAPNALAPDDSAWGAQRWLALGLGAGGVLALGVSGLLSGLALDANARSEANCDGLCNARGIAQRDDALALGNGATVSVVAGAALLAGAAVLFFTEPDEQAPASGLAVAVGPMIGPWTGTELGLEIRGAL